MHVLSPINLAAVAVLSLRTRTSPLHSVVVVASTRAEPSAYCCCPLPSPTLCRCFIRDDSARRIAAARAEHERKTLADRSAKHERFMRIVLHELRTPCNCILQQLDVDGSVSDAKLQTQVLKMLRLVQDVEDADNFANGKSLVLRTNKFLLIELLQVLVKALSDEYSNAAVTVELAFKNSNSSSKPDNSNSSGNSSTTSSSGSSSVGVSSSSADCAFQHNQQKQQQQQQQQQQQRQQQQQQQKQPQKQQPVVVPTEVIGDIQALSRVLTHLLENALRYTEHGFVRLELVCDEVTRLCKFNVLNTGPVLDVKAAYAACQHYWAVTKATDSTTTGSSIRSSISSDSSRRSSSSNSTDVHGIEARCVIADDVDEQDSSTLIEDRQVQDVAVFGQKGIGVSLNVAYNFLQCMGSRLSIDYSADTGVSSYSFTLALPVLKTELLTNGSGPTVAEDEEVRTSTY
jgi:signal transduction histidine kinase